MKIVLQALVGAGTRSETVAGESGVLEQGLLEATGPMVELSGDLPQQKGLQEENGLQAQTAISQR